MSVRDLIPWNRTTGTPAPTALSNEAANPFLTLHREVNRLFDDVFTGFGSVPSLANRSFGWPNVERLAAITMGATKCSQQPVWRPAKLLISRLPVPLRRLP